MGARKELVISGPGGGKTTYLVSHAIQPSTVSLDPVGALRKRVAGHVEIMHADRPDALAFLRSPLLDLIRAQRAVLIDVSSLLPSQAHALGDALGFLLRDHFRNGTLVVDEFQNLVPKVNAVDNGLVNFITKSRNFNVEVVLSVHRPQMANTDVRGLVDTTRIGRMSEPLDVEMARKVLGLPASEETALAARLSNLQPGEWIVKRSAAPG